MRKTLNDLFKSHFNEEVESSTALPSSPSGRSYFRLKSKSHTAIGSVHTSISETKAFIEFANHFRSKNIPVPEIFNFKIEDGIYLQEDLGEQTLYNYLSKARSASNPFPKEIEELYLKVVKTLPKLQIEGHAGLDYSVCVESEVFDAQNMLWDMYYFKYCFLRTVGIKVHERKLEEDFQAVAEYLSKFPTNSFLSRDFQSRNIMVRDGEVFFIDFQSGRKGPLGYDIASLLFQSTAEIPGDARERLFQEYLAALKEHTEIDEEEFRQELLGLALIRILQNFGAYGFLGLQKGRLHFVKSIPLLCKITEEVLGEFTAAGELATLKEALDQVVHLGAVQKIKEQAPARILVWSFGFEQGSPFPERFKGGGHTFDCRMLEETATEYDGRDEELIKKFAKNSKVSSFIESISNLVTNTLPKKLNESLVICVGDSMGRELSVYIADELAKKLNSHGFPVELFHRELHISERH